MQKTEWLALGSVLGILGVVSGYLILDARSQLRDVIRIAHMRDVQMGLDLFYGEQGIYPEASESLALGQANSACLQEEGFSAPCPSGSDPFMAFVPASPTQGLSEEVSCSGVENAYCYVGNNSGYRITFVLESAHTRLGLQEGVNCLTDQGFFAGACPAL